MHADDSQSQATEAACYAVLRRVGPALRHDLIVNLQAVVMMSEVMGARLDKGLLAHADLQDQVSRIQRATREAIANALKVAAWLDPQEDDRIGLREGLQDCLDLVRGGFEFRGVHLRTQWFGQDMDVSRNMLRHLIPAAMIRVADQGGGPGALLVNTRVNADRALLDLRFSRSPEAEADPDDEDINYRRLEAGDLQVLARLSDVVLREDGGRIEMALPRLVPTTALQIAPL